MTVRWRWIGRGGLIAVVLGALLGGCLARAGGALVGLHAALTPQTVPADRLDTPGEAPNQDTPDTALRARLAEVYANIPALTDVRVAVVSGVVQLQGRVLGAAARQDALEIAAGMDGVVYVVDDLELETDVGRTLAPALVRLQEYAVTAFRYSPLLLVAAGVVAAFWLLATLLGRWQAPYERLGLNPLLRGLIAQLVRAALFLAGILLALDLLGATAVVTAVLGTAGLAGLAVGFAFRDIVENYLAGVLLSLRQPFSVGDHLRLGEFEGRVVRLTSREMVLMTLDGNHVRVPNSTVFGSVILNFTRNPRRRFEFELSVGTAQDLSVVQRLGTDALRALPGVLTDPGPYTRVQAVVETSVVLGFYGWVDQREVDFSKVRSEGLKLVKETLSEAGILALEAVTTVRLQEAEAPRAGPPPPLAALRARAQDVDVTPDHALDVPLAEELADPDEPNLLEPRTPPFVKRAAGRR